MLFQMKMVFATVLTKPLIFYKIFRWINLMIMLEIYVQLVFFLVYKKLLRLQFQNISNCIIFNLYFQWIAKSILHRLSSEINKINCQLSQFGLENALIGVASIDRLRKLMENREFISKYLTTLPLLIPFLDANVNQEYLVKRIHGEHIKIINCKFYI